MALRSFFMAATSIWRMRSAETPYSLASSCSPAFSPSCRHRLSTASLGRTRVSNLYNAAGQRVRKTVDTREILFHYAPDGQLLAETEATGSPLREYIYLDQMPLSLTVHTRKPGRAPSGKGPPSGQGPPPHAPLPDPATTMEVHTYYVHPDHLGTPQRLTDRHQQIVWDAVYAPFGEVTLRTEQVMQPLRFPGQYADPETGLHPNWHRDYDPALGRYIQSDPIGLSGGINTYAYALGNPIQNVDIYGLDVKLCRRPADLPFPLNLFDHSWIKTDSQEVGMGGECPVPGQGCADKPYSQTVTKDHSGQSEAINSTCEVMNNVDEECVNDLIRPGQPTGSWHPFNQCQSFAYSVINRCRMGPQLEPRTK
jgi:RHS repeat-associated protein